MNSNDQPVSAAALRVRAEARLRERAVESVGDLAALSPAATQHLLHELQTHQIELELQNEELRRTLADLDATRARYFDLYDLAPVGYCALSATGLIVQANLTATTLLGVPRGALTTQRFSRFIIAEDADQFHLLIKQLFAGGEPQACELRLCKPDGTLFWARLDCAAAQADDGTPQARVVLTDISERTHAASALRASEAFNRAILDSLDEHVAVIDAQGVIVAVNAAWREFARSNGAPELAEQAIGVNYLAVCAQSDGHPFGDEAPDVLSGIQAVLTGIRTEFQLEYPCHSPTEQRWFRLSVTPLRDGSGKAVVSHLNITQRKQAELKLVDALQQAQAANQAKNAFLSRMSHELRTPLNAIVGFAQIILLSADDEKIGTFRSDLETMLRSGWHLTRIVEDLLNVSAIEANKVVVNIERFDLAPCLLRCFELLAPLAKERGITLGSAAAQWEGVFIQADEFRLRQVLINLLANAIKYNRDGGSVTVSSQHTPGRLRILVADTGVGIRADHLAELFEPFSRVTERPYEIEGAGVGLAVVKQLTGLMGGTLGVESVYGQGSTFWIEFPTALAPPAAATQLTTPTPTAPRESQATVLYVEDNPVHIHLVRSILARLPQVALLTATTPREGLALARAQRPSIILLDIFLPEMDGFEVLKLLQLDALTRGIPVLAITATATPVEIEKGLRAGFRHYLTKPLNVVAFMSAVENVLAEVAAAQR